MQFFRACSLQDSSPMPYISSFFSNALINLFRIPRKVMISRKSTVSMRIVLNLHHIVKIDSSVSKAKKDVYTKHLLGGPYKTK